MPLFKDQKELDEYCLACISAENREIHDKVCYARREMDLCPQADVVEKLKRKLEWLEENRCLKKNGEYQAPESGDSSLADC